jgi:hypothetical protein
MDSPGLSIFDASQLTYAKMSEIVLAIAHEIKRRNPIFINAYVPHILVSAALLKEISEGEAGNFTSECGPKEPKRQKKAKVTKIRS